MVERFYTSGDYSEYHGLTLHSRKFNDDAMVSGAVNAMFMENEITKEQCDEIVETMNEVAKNGYTIKNGIAYYAGLIGAGRSLVNEDGKKQLDEFIQRGKDVELEIIKNSQFVTPRQAKATLIELGKDEELENLIQEITDVKQRKQLLNWYRESTQWQYSNKYLTQALDAIKIDKDKFFEMAKSL